VDPVMKPSMSDEAVKAKTGKDWDEWFRILDGAGAQQMDHKQIVAYLVEHHQVEPWWRQMVTVSYEQARGLREKHETPGGFQVSRSRTLAAPVNRVYAAWEDEGQREQWLRDAGLAVRKATQDKSLRITWADGETRLDVELYPKGEQKTQVTVQHSGLKDAGQADQMKVYWADALTRLEAFLSGGEG
jgi:Activator of Hsp90 ATPase homolog 1-like protein